MLGLVLFRYFPQVNSGIAFRKASECCLPHSFQLVHSPFYPTLHIDRYQQCSWYVVA